MKMKQKIKIEEIDKMGELLKKKVFPYYLADEKLDFLSEELDEILKIYKTKLQAK